MRLVPVALASWAAAFHVVALPVAAGLGLAGAALLVAALAGWRTIRDGARSRARHRGRAGTPPAAAVLLTALAVAAVSLSATVQAGLRSGGLLAELTEVGASALLSGRVVTEPQALAGRDWEESGRYRVVVEVREVSGRGLAATARAPVVVLGPAGWGEVELGEEVRVRGAPRATEPGDEAVALLFAGADPERLSPPPVHLRPVVRLRAALHEAVADLGPRARGLVPGIALGDDRYLPDGLREDMRAVAMTHLTAVSGTHLSIVLGAVLGASAWLPRRARALVGTLALLGFVTLVRPEPSVLRSGLMGAVVLAGLLLGRPARALPALGGAVALLVLVDPWLARSYGFVLSVLGTTGLVLLARPWARWLSHLLPRWLATVVAVPAAAQAACGPVVLLLEPAVPLYSVPANILAAPAVPGATLLGVLATVLAPWPGAARAVAWLASLFAEWIALVAQLLADMPGARLGWPGTPGGAVALGGLTLLLVLLLGRLRPPRPGPWLPAGAAALLLLLIPGPRGLLATLLPGGVPADWVAVQCDVGQGSAFLLRSGPSSAVMVDVGEPAAGAAECLSDAGVARLDLLVLTHPHMDHVGGLPEVLDGVEVRETLLSPATGPEGNVTAVRDQLARAGVPARVPRAAPGAARPAGAAGEVRWEVLWPTESGAGGLIPLGATAANDLSVVVRLDTPELSVVALGDLELAGQGRLLREVREDSAPPADVVVMAHHGSPRQDSALADLLAPRLTLVSVGAGNDYGHPAPEAIAMYDRHGTVLRTDLCGPITLVATSSGLATLADCGR